MLIREVKVSEAIQRDLQVVAVVMWRFQLKFFVGFVVIKKVVVLL